MIQSTEELKKAAGEGAGDNYEHITYEGYGPNGTAIIVKTLTDNKKPDSFKCTQRVYKRKWKRRHARLCIIYV